MSKAQFGMLGLGTMGRNFLLNVAENGFSCLGFDLNAENRELFVEQGSNFTVSAADDLAAFIAGLESPRNIMLLLPAGPVVDSAIADLVVYLESGDMIIDGGNSHFTDTERREADLAEKGIRFLGAGVSGGEKGARFGPSIMAGGTIESYERVRMVFEAISARVDGEPCAAHVGSGSAGHFVKMVHNGIEYAMMQLIAEAYDLLGTLDAGSRNAKAKGTDTIGSALSDSEIAEIFAKWNTGELRSYLIEVTAAVLAKADDKTGKSLVSLILDVAGQKGTGKWTSQAAMDLGVPIPTIDSAVSMRHVSSQKQLRMKLAESLSAHHNPLSTGLDVAGVRDALYAAFILTYAQGMSLLQAASENRNYGLDLAGIAKIWRGGCIIRASVLEEIRTAYAGDLSLENLLLDDQFAAVVSQRSIALRRTVAAFISSGIPAMCFGSALSYYDAIRAARLPANLIQAQRDHFGAHTYQRIDEEGTFHTDEWGQ